MQGRVEEDAMCYELHYYWMKCKMLHGKQPFYGKFHGRENKPIVSQTTLQVLVDANTIEFIDKLSLWIQPSHPTFCNMSRNLLGPLPIHVIALATVNPFVAGNSYFWSGFNHVLKTKRSSSDRKSEACLLLVWNGIRSSIVGKNWWHWNGRPSPRVYCWDTMLQLWNTWEVK